MDEVVYTINDVPRICLFCANFDAGQRPIARSRFDHATRGGHRTIYGDCLALTTPEFDHVQTASTNSCDEWTANHTQEDAQ